MGKLAERLSALQDFLTYHFAKEHIYEVALEVIASIPNQYEGGDWAEIESARAVAKRRWVRLSMKRISLP
jgi:hypothetical protein